MSHTNGIIYLMRGDSYSFPLSINLGTAFTPEMYYLQEGDALYFGLMQPNQAFENAVLKKKYTYESDTDDEGNILIELNPEDTVNLPVGKYFYMVKLLRKINGKNIVNTIINPTQFFLTGNNPCTPNVYYTNDDDYKITDIIVDGGEVDIDGIIWDGGEIT